MLSRCLEANGAEGDTDVLIVTTAVKCAENREVALLGEDTDLLVLLCYHANLENNRIYFKSEPKQRLTSKGLRVWDIKKTKVLLGPDACRLLPFIHALIGSDTLSRVYGISKGAALKNSTADQQFKLHVEIFLKESTKGDIVAAEEGALVSLYGGIPIEDLHLLRFRKFANRVMTSSSFVQVYTLPRTSAAAKYQSMRVYHQVQEWTTSVSYYQKSGDGL